MLFDWYKTNLQGRVQEVAMAAIFLEDESHEYYAADLPALYEEFKQLYPQSILRSQTEKAVQKNAAFNQAELPEGVNILNTDIFSRASFWVECNINAPALSALALSLFGYACIL